MVRFHYKLHDCCCIVSWWKRGQSVITFSFHFRREFMKKAVFSKQSFIRHMPGHEMSSSEMQNLTTSFILLFKGSFFLLTFTSCYGHFVEPPCVINQIEFFTNGSKFNFVWTKKRNWNEKFSFTANLRTSDCPSVTIYAVWWTKKKQKCSWKIIIYEFSAAGSLL